MIKNKFYNNKNGVCHGLIFNENKINSKFIKINIKKKKIVHSKIILVCKKKFKNNESVVKIEK